MASAWSRISSKVIAHPPYADEACRRWCGNWNGYSGTFIPHIADKRKPEVLGEVTLFPHMRGACVPSAWTDYYRHRPTRKPGVHHVLHHTIRQTTHQSQTASPPYSAGALGEGPTPSTTGR